MHVRLSTSIGLPVREEQNGEVVGSLSGILIDPNSGVIEGFYIDVPGFVGNLELFCSSLDVLKWGTTISIRNRDIVSSVEEHVRLLPLLEDKRTVLDQVVRTESGKRLGKCKDVQFDTDKMQFTWIFPKRWCWWGIAIPRSEIIEITEDAIHVKDPPVPSIEREEAFSPKEALEALQDITDPGIARPG